MIITRIRLIARKDKQLELLQTGESLSARIAQEKGCLNCQVYRSTSNPLEILISEEWVSEEALNRHLESDSLTILAGAGSILSSKVEIFTGNDVPTRVLQKQLEKKLKKKTEIIEPIT
jgi:quinol monooxygenase YgiN